MNEKLMFFTRNPQILCHVCDTINEDLGKLKLFTKLLTYNENPNSNLT